jgi:hypothetical protein
MDCASGGSVSALTTQTHTADFVFFLLHSEGRVQTAKVWMRKQQHYFLVVVVAYGVVSAAASCGW